MPVQKHSVDFEAFRFERLALDISAALLDSQKIEAIKLYRAGTGAGLKESKDLIEAVESHQKIEAIKMHRALTGVGLKEAKDFVERIVS